MKAPGRAGALGQRHCEKGQSRSSLRQGPAGRTEGNFGRTHPEAFRGRPRQDRKPERLVKEISRGYRTETIGASARMATTARGRNHALPRLENVSGQWGLVATPAPIIVSASGPPSSPARARCRRAISLAATSQLKKRREIRSGEYSRAPTMLLRQLAIGKDWICLVGRGVDARLHCFG